MAKIKDFNTKFVERHYQVVKADASVVENETERI